MMQISFVPKFSASSPPASPPAVSKSGDVLTVNGAAYDFSSLPDGATIPAGEVPSQWIVGPVERIAGVLHVTLILPHGMTPSQAVAFPQPITVTVDGPIAVPHDPEPEEPTDVDA